MSPPGAMRVKLYHRCRLEIQDDGRQGWTIHIHTSRGGKPGTIRNRVPEGPAVLQEEARTRVDHECGDWATPRW